MTTTQRDQAVPSRVVVRILDGAGEPVGAGFVIGPDLVATCAHVVAAAVRSDPYDPMPPSRRVELDLPLLFADSPERVTAEVARWIPIAPEGTGDIAVLRVRDPLPEGARMPPLRRVDQLWDHPFRVLGFPDGMADGVWATGRFRGQQGTRWFQMQGTAGEQPIVEGFSGSPVWDETSGAVVGMTVATDLSGTTTAYLIPIDQVLGVDPELLPCPYRGLEPFGEEHASFFFGRDGDVDRLVDAVTRRPLVAVAGPSGAGKSSLVRAGLLPRLRAEGVPVAELRPLPGRPAAELLAEVVPAGTRERLVLVVDQFEELAATDPGAATELLERIGDLVRESDGVRAVLTLRSATLDDVLVPELAGLLGSGTVLLPPMDRGQLRNAIVAPAERAPGLSFEPGLVDRILDDAAAEPGQLPLVESLLTELWARREGGHLTLRAYEEAGGVAGVVATHAEAVVAGFDAPDADRLRRLFTALAGPDRDGRFVRRPLRWGEVAADLRPLVLRLAAGRLVVVERDTDGQERIQLAHQALIAHWPRLRDWLTDDRDFLGWRDQVGLQRERWEETGRDDGALLRGAALATALDRLPARAADVPAADVEFVQRSRTRQRREVRRWRIVTAVLAVITLAAGVLAVVAVDRGNALGDQLDLANAELLGQASIRLAPSDPVAAIQLALAGYRLDPQKPSVRSALLHEYMATRSVEGVLAGVAAEPIMAFGPADEGRAMLVRDSGGAFVLTGLPLGPVHRQALDGVPPDVRRINIGDDGRHVAAVAGQSVLLWDPTTGTGPRVLSSPAGDAAIEPAVEVTDNRIGWLEADGSGGNRLRIWDVTARRPAPYDGTPVPERGVTGLALSDDGTSVMMRTGDPLRPDSRLVVRRLGDGAELGSFPGGSLPLSPGDRVATCEVDASGRAQAVVRTIVGGAELRRVPLVAADCARFSELGTVDGGHHVAERIAPPGDYDVVRIIDLDDGSVFDVTVPPDPNTASSGIGNRMVVLPGPDGTRTVLMPRGTSILRLRADPNPYTALFGDPPRLDVSDDGRTVVALYGRFGATTFDATTRRPVARLDPLAPPATATSSVDDRLGILGGTPRDGMVLAQYALPALAPVVRAPIPRRPGEPAQAAAVSSAGDRLFTLADGLLAEFDRTTGAPIGAPIDLAPTQSARDWFAGRAGAVLAARGGGRPDEVVVLAPDNTIELWDVARGERIAALPHREGRLPIWFAPDAEGSRLLVSTQTGVQEVWDLDRQEIIGEPFPAPGFPLPIGFTADGRAVTSTRRGDGTTQTFWDVATGADDGTIHFMLGHDGALEIDDGTWMKVGGVGGEYGGPLPFRMATTAQQWVERLCTFSNRPFTDVERAALPGGSVIEPPC
ncbi:nSTAND1 domain-containing NTPase [Pseudonocardia sp. DLS-67]